jgi:UDP-N-acetylmuramate dehydrogenase
VLAAADAVERPVFVLGAGSNLLVADRGYPGVVVRYIDDECTFHDRGCGDIVVEAAAGVVWDDLVEDAVAREFAGIECLSGIPGLVGAAPIQNIGAYGQEIAEAVTCVVAVDRSDGETHRLGAAECVFTYRSSRFKTAPDRWLVVGLELHLRRGGAPRVRYPGLARTVEARVPRGRDPTLQDVRDAVLEVRASKSMVLSATDPNRRSAGSFFTNPIVEASVADAAGEAAATIAPGVPMPRFPAGDRVKLSAAWLIERAGFPRGYGEGRAGLSTKHCLALVNRGEATAADLIALASTVRRGVRDTFGVSLVPEPVFLGFEQSIDELLDPNGTPS